MPQPTPLDCTITAMKKPKQGPLLVQATCPLNAPLGVGLTGQIIDPATGGPLKNGQVRIKSIKKTKIAGEAPALKQPVQATILRFMIKAY